MKALLCDCFTNGVIGMPCDEVGSSVFIIRFAVWALFILSAAPLPWAKYRSETEREISFCLQNSLNSCEINWGPPSVSIFSTMSNPLNIPLRFLMTELVVLF